MTTDPAELLSILQAVLAGQIGCRWGWNAAKDKMMYWSVDSAGDCIEGHSYDTPEEAAEAAWRSLKP